MVNNKELCCGCSACASVCPKDAIAMKQNKYGFYQPCIDKDSCINCNLCEKVCPANLINTKYMDNPVGSYAFANNSDEIRINSSSGGTFYELAKTIIDQSGMVYGVAWSDVSIAEHIAVETSDELRSLMKSKYVQSNPGLIFRKVKADLIEGKKVLFSGSPCQINGLMNYLGKDYDNLITVDFICHGVPSQKALENFKKNAEKISGKKITNLDFRTKANGWEKLSLEMTFDGSEKKIEKASDNSYYRAFLSNLSLNKACGECRYNCLPRTSDITLGDYWQINLPYDRFKDNKGVSCIVLNSRKGADLFDKIKEKATCVPVSIEDIKRGNPFINGHCKLHPRRDIFFKKIDEEENFDELVKSLLAPTKYELIIEICKSQIDKIFRKIKVFKEIIREKREKRKLRKSIRTTDFSIISNNCWGSFVYQKYGLEYQSPIAGLYILGHDFVKLCRNLQHYLNLELEFIKWEESSYYSVLKGKAPYPVAKLGDIEIYFMHYHSEQEAAEKWYRRAKRINPEKLIFKLSQREGCSKKDIEDFMALPLKNKVCFAYDEVPGTIHVPELKDFKGDEFPIVQKYFDELKLINEL